MGEKDYSTVAAIANERPDIGITASSTPTGRRGTFYKMNMDKSWGYTAWHIPSQRSPLFTQELDDRAKAEFSQVEYEHEILAEFGTEEMGVFNKDKLDEARTKLFYTYDELSNLQIRRLGDGPRPLSFVYKDGDRTPQNLYRTMGVDQQDKRSVGIKLLEYPIIGQSAAKSLILLRERFNDYAIGFRLHNRSNSSRARNRWVGESPLNRNSSLSKI